MLCGEGFDSKSAFQDHMELTHNFTELQEEDQDTLLKSKNDEHSQNILIMPKYEDRFHAFQNGKRCNVATDRPKLFNCSKCDREFHSLTSLENHEHLHYVRRQYICHQCQTVLCSKSSLCEHMRSIHFSEDFERECMLCNEKFSSNQKFEAHTLENHPGEQPFACSECSERFLRLFDLEDHRVNKHNTSKKDLTKTNWCCPVCGLRFVTRRNVLTHMRSNCHLKQKVQPEVDSKESNDCSQSLHSINDDAVTNGASTSHVLRKNFPCGLCSKVLTSRWSYKNHMLMHTLQEKNHACTKCKKRYRTKHALKSHEKTHAVSTFACTKCDANYKTRGSLRCHAVVVHGEQVIILQECKVCKNKFSSKSALEAHTLANHPGERPFACAECGATFSLLVHLRGHRKNHRSGSCRVCGKFYISFAQLAVHERTHIPNEKRHEAVLCGVCGKHVLNYKIHMRKHTREQPYECNLCGKRFGYKNGLKGHQRQHTGERPYLCVKCGATYSCMSGYRYHLENPRGCSLRRLRQKTAAEKLKPKIENPPVRILENLDAFQESKIRRRKYVCNDCDENFKTKTFLLAHIESVHPGKLLEIQRKKRKVRRACSTSDSFSTMELPLKIFSCTKCADTFPSRYRLMIHKRVVHLGESPKRTTKVGRVSFMNKIGEINFSCAECPEIFPSRYKLELHERYIHRGELPPVRHRNKTTLAGDAILPNSAKNECSCSHCYEIFPSANLLSLHICGQQLQLPVSRSPESSMQSQQESLAHSPKLKKEYKCKYCSEQFISKYRLKKHKNVNHSWLESINCNTTDLKEYSYACTQCVKCFRFKHELEYHEHTHYINNLHTCTHCVMQFETTAALDEHERSHEKEDCMMFFKKTTDQNHDVRATENDEHINNKFVKSANEEVCNPQKEQNEECSELSEIENISEEEQEINEPLIKLEVLPDNDNFNDENVTWHVNKISDSSRIENNKNPAYKKEFDNDARSNAQKDAVNKFFDNESISINDEFKKKLLKTDCRVESIATATSRQCDMSITATAISGDIGNTFQSSSLTNFDSELSDGSRKQAQQTRRNEKDESGTQARWMDDDSDTMDYDDTNVVNDDVSVQASDFRKVSVKCARGKDIEKGDKERNHSGNSKSRVTELRSARSFVPRLGKTKQIGRPIETVDFKSKNKKAGKTAERTAPLDLENINEEQAFLSSNIENISELNPSKPKYQQTGVKKFVPTSCLVCNEILVGQEALLRHMQEKHPGEKPYECKVCSKRYRRRRDFVDHEQSHVEENRFSCTECGSRFSNRSFLFKHEVFAHRRMESKMSKKAKYHCTVCDQGFGLKLTLEIHTLENHPGFNPFSCPECSASFPQMKLLSRHRARMHNDRNQCPICLKRFQDHLDVHMLTHTDIKPYACDLCGQGFRQIGALRLHEERHTSTERLTIKNDNVENCSRTFLCGLCGKSFTFRQALKRHEKRVHENGPPRNEPKKSSYLCGTCGRKLCSKGSLTNHMRIHTGEGWFTCERCSKSFTCKGSLIQHQQQSCGKVLRRARPTGKNSKAVVDKPCRCSRCGEILPNIVTYCQHVSSTVKCERNKELIKEAGGLSTFCGVCEKRIRSRSFLIMHLRGHTGEKPYICPYCDERYPYPNGFKRHLSICAERPADELQNCSHCGGKFSRNDLELHQGICAKGSVTFLNF